MRRWNPTRGTDDVVQLDDEKYAFNGVWIWNLYELYIVYNIYIYICIPWEPKPAEILGIEKYPSFSDKPWKYGLGTS